MRYSSPLWLLPLFERPGVPPRDTYTNFIQRTRSSITKWPPPHYESCGNIYRRSSGCWAHRYISMTANVCVSVCVLSKCVNWVNVLLSMSLLTDDSKLTQKFKKQSKRKGLLFSQEWLSSTKKGCLCFFKHLHSVCGGLSKWVCKGIFTLDKNEKFSKKGKKKVLGTKELRQLFLCAE